MMSQNSPEIIIRKGKMEWERERGKQGRAGVSANHTPMLYHRCHSKARSRQQDAAEMM
jgi:hypothetical protein